MYNSLSHKTKQFFWLILKMSIVIACGYFIYLKLFQNNRLSFYAFKEILLKNEILSFKNALILVLFSSVNWFFEILKWQTLASFCQKTSIKSATIQSLAALTTSLITPNRIGEYPAKALYFEKNKRKQVLGLNFLHNSSQLLATLLFGILGLSFLVVNQKIALGFTTGYMPILILLLFGLTGYFSYRNFHYVQRQFQKACVFFKEIPTVIKRKTILFAVARYLVFTHQFYFLIICFTIPLSYWDALAAIASMYLLASIVPVLSIFDGILKGAVAIFIFSFFNVIEIKILSISLLMWMFNFVFPAIIGSYFVLTFTPK